MQLNLDDIARLAGVSRTTVSRVINDHPDVSASTRQKVWRVIEEQNFHPNPVAQMLAAQRTRILGIVIGNPVRAFRSHYASILFQGVQAVAIKHDYATLIWWSGGTAEENERFSERIFQRHRLMDGMLIATGEVDPPLIDQLLAANMPFVMTAKPTRHLDRISYVTVDNLYSAQLAVEHLIGRGCKHIAHITGRLYHTDGLERLEGYRITLEQHGLGFDPRLVAEAEFTRETGYAAMRELLARGVKIDGLFVGNDDSAEGAMLALQQAGIRVPEDIAVVSFDDVPTAQDFSPQLSTIHQPIYERGARATTLLLDIIDGVANSPQHIILPTHLVVRQS